MAEPEAPAAIVPNPDEAHLDALAAAADAGETLPEAPAKPAVEPEKLVEGQPPEPKPDELKPAAQRERGPDGKFVKRTDAEIEADTDAAKAEVLAARPETAFSKAQKEEQRQKNLLANFDKEKEQVRAKAAELAEKERQLQQVEQQRRPEATLHGHTAREYEMHAREFAKDGDHENAYKATLAFLQLRQFEAQHFQQQASKAATDAWKSGMDNYIKANPKWEFGDTPECRAVNAILDRFPQLGFLPDGFEKACEVAEKFMDAENVAELRTTLAEAQAEITKLRGATQPVAGGPAGQPKKKTALDINDLARMAQEADAA